MKAAEELNQLSGIILNASIRFIEKWDLASLNQFINIVY